MSTYTSERKGLCLRSLICSQDDIHLSGWRGEIYGFAVSQVKELRKNSKQTPEL